MTKRFVFDDDALEVVIAGKEEQETENKFVGGANRWSYDSFVNWVSTALALASLLLGVLGSAMRRMGSRETRM